MSLIGDMTTGDDIYQVDRNVHTAIEFHQHYFVALGEMKKAAELMLKCYKETGMKKYDRRHKKMVRIIKEWGKNDNPNYYDK